MESALRNSIVNCHMAVDVLSAEDVWDLDRKNSQFCLPWVALLVLCLYCATDVSTSLKLHVIFFTGSFPEPYLVALIRDGTIQAIDLATLHTTVVLSDLKDVYWYSNLAVDYVDKKLYFNHRWRIARANFDGTNMEIIPSQDRIQHLHLMGLDDVCSGCIIILSSSWDLCGVFRSQI